MRARVLGQQQRREEAHHAGLLHGRERHLRQRDRRQLVAGRVDDMVDDAHLGEQGREVLLEGGRVGQVAGEAGDVAGGGGGGVAACEAGEGGGDARGGRGGDGDVAEGFEAGFGDAETDAAGAAEDEDAGVGEFGGVFLGVGHGGG